MDIDVMLCDHAQVEGGKLFISGGNIDRMLLPAGPPPYAITFTAAGIVRVPWHETNTEHVLSLEVLTEDGQQPPLPAGAEGRGGGAVGGEMRFNVGRPPQLASGDEQLVPFAFGFQGLPLMALGRYALVFTLDGSEARLVTFTVTHAHPQGAGVVHEQ